MSLADEARKYYDAMASVYEETAGYNDPESEKLRGPAKARYRELFKGRRVLEIACGSGYWTEVIGQTARSLLATDINASMIEQAKLRCRHLSNVEFLVADACSLKNVCDSFDAAFANCWWSHMPKSLIPAFLAALHSKLKAGSIVLFVDQLPADSGFSAKNAKALKIADGNRLEVRTAPDGRTYEVLKNYPTRSEIVNALEAIARDIRYTEVLGVWSVLYRV